MRTEIRNLKVVLTYDELQEKGQDLAKANRDIAEKEAQKKRVTAQLGADIKALQEKVLSLSYAIQNGYVYDDIECRWVRDTTRSKCYLNAYDEETLKSICCKNYLTIIDEGTPEPEQLVLFGG